MSHPLQRRIAALRSHSRCMAAIYGLSVVSLAVAAAAIALGALDCVFRFEDRGVRLIASLAVLAVWLWSVIRFVWPVLRHRPSEVELARRIEREYPQLRDRLRSAVQFLRAADDDPLAGSPALRRAAVAAIAAETEGIDFRGVVDTWPARRAAFALGVVCLALGILVVAAPQSVLIAAQRLLAPFGDTAWPADDGRIARRAADYQPPTIESISVTLVPPVYTGWPAVQSPPLIRALIGTRAEVTAACDRRPRSAALCFRGGGKIPARLDADGRRLTFDGFTVKRNSAYWIELTDADGDTSISRQWEIEAVADRPPRVEIERPAERMFVTPQADVPLEISAWDDIALRRIVLEFGSNESAAEGRATLYEGRRRESNPAAALPDAEGEQLRQKFRWQLAAQKMRPGTEVAFRAAAEDFAGQGGCSRWRRLSVVSPDELREKIAAELAALAVETAKVLQAQRGCLEDVDTLRRQKGEPITERKNLLQAVESRQRELHERLTGADDGIAARANAMLSANEINRLDAAAMQSCLEELSSMLAVLEREHLPRIDGRLAAALRAARVERAGQGRAAENKDDIKKALDDAAAAQQAVIEALGRWLARMEQFEGVEQIIRRIARLAQAQRELARRVEEIGRRTLGVPPHELAPRQAAELTAAAVAQLALVWSFERTVPEIRRAAERLDADAPDAAERLRNAVELALRLVPSTAMRHGAELIEMNRIGLAAAAQRRALDGLREMLAVISGREMQPADDAQPDDVQSADDSPDDGSSGREPGGGDARPGERPGAASSIRPDPAAQARQPNAQSAREAVERFWGNLPPQERQSLLQMPPDDFPPQYGPLVREYFLRLWHEENKP